MSDRLTEKELAVLIDLLGRFEPEASYMWREQILSMRRMVLGYALTLKGALDE